MSRQTLWELAAKAEQEVAKWPRWKRNAADLALVTPKDQRGAHAQTGQRQG